MEKTQVKFSAAEEVKEFVRAAEKCDFDIDVIYNKIVVDAKSLLGVLTLAAYPVYVACHGTDAAFNSVCQKFAY